MAKKYAELRARMAPEEIAESERLTQELNDEMPLQQLRHALQITQAQIAASMGVTQAAVSKLENQEDMLIGTLQRILEAMGGELELRVHFPTGNVVLTDIGKRPPQVRAERLAEPPDEFHYSAA